MIVPEQPKKGPEPAGGHTEVVSVNGRRVIVEPERTARLIEQLELQLEDLVTSATEDELVAQAASAKTQTVRSFTRKWPVRKPRSRGR